MPAIPNLYEQEMRLPSTGLYSGQLPYPVAGGIPYPTDPSELANGDFTDYPPEERAALRAAAAQFKDPYDEDLAYGSLPTPATGRQQSASVRQEPYGQVRPQSGSYQYTPQVIKGSQPAYSHPEPYQYAKPPTNITYTSKPHASTSRKLPGDAPLDYTTTRVPVTSSQQIPTTPAPWRPYPPPSPRSSHARIVEVAPGGLKPSSMGLTPQMNHLSVSGVPLEMSGALPPPSPLLEAYQGTYQSISPMASPMMLAHESDMDELPPLLQLTPSSTNSKHGSSKHKRSKSDSVSHGSKHAQSGASSSHVRQPEQNEKKRVKVYDAAEDAKILNESLSHHRGPDAYPICDILPHLTHDQILELRSEYKRIAKVSGRGINIAKHIKMKLSGNFGKAAYVTALGRWESEGYWANFWYQSHGSRRELLIESLMGRSNAEIREIKDSFRDKRYSDDLVKCMEKELKADKFRIAVLNMLEEKRQEETDYYPREYVDKDAAILYRCILMREGGESAMLDIITRRSDAHLREVLQTYERQYQRNFAREALQKSNNLVVSITFRLMGSPSAWAIAFRAMMHAAPCHRRQVLIRTIAYNTQGEIIAHILNGVINKPARDALLLRHAVTDIKSHNKEDELRYELLISRLVRLHWDRAHLARVKREYRQKYGQDLADDIDKSTKGDFREFMFELCQQ